MAASHSDSNVLETDSQFTGRVRASIIAAAINIASEAITQSTLQLHLKRASLAAQILANPDNYKSLFASSVATDASCLADATQAGTVALTSANVAAQAALVTDTHIDNAVSGQFNAFLTLP